MQYYLQFELQPTTALAVGHVTVTVTLCTSRSHCAEACSTELQY